MGEDTIDFGDGVKTTPPTGATSSMDTTDITGSAAKPGDSDITDKDNSGDKTDTTTVTAATTTSATTKTDDKSDSTSTDASTGSLKAGTNIEFEGETYTVSENGDVVDKDGNVFKAANEVQDWLKEYEQTDDNTLEGVSINDIIESVGIDVNDDKGNKIEFSNDKEGLKAYINAVSELKSEETRKATINKFYQDNPLIKQFNDYLTVNGGDPRGFGEIPDRSGIVVDKDNVIQQEHIIRVAAVEFGNKSVTDAYIKYLKDSGGLYDEAVNQLVALQDKDKAVRERIERDAEAARKAEEDGVRAYWENVNKVISSRNIAGYKIPESFVKEENGQKIVKTPDDFYDYLYKAKEVDANGNKITGYQKDLNKLTDAELLNRELLEAWLMFTGGTYKDLVNMAAKEQEVHKLVLKARSQRSSRTIKIQKASDKADVSGIVYE